MAAYLAIAATDEGSKLTAALESSPFMYTITTIPGYPAQTFMNSQTISVDPNFNPVLYTTDGQQVASTEVILEHELGHAVTGLPDEGPINVIDEVENPFRAELGLPYRIAYPAVAMQPFGSPPYNSFQLPPL